MCNGSGRAVMWYNGSIMAQQQCKASEVDADLFRLENRDKNQLLRGKK